ncbi:MAG: cardiolipin synthase ClsB [Burkholderiales bacterium]|nr:cardiolipin synthase ClsB [Burkholderiales bacterium]
MNLTPGLQGGHQLRLLRGGEALFPALHAAIRGAVHEVWLASYIVHTDAVSAQLADALAAAARRGVRVRLLVDGFGSRHAIAWWRERLADSPVALAVFRPLESWWQWLQPGQLRRLHLKLCVVDGAQAFVGGINVIDDRLDLNHGPLDAPRLDFAVGFEGPAVAQVDAQLRRLWARSWLGRDFGDELRLLLDASHPLTQLRGWFGSQWLRFRGAYGRAQERRRERLAAEADDTPVRLAYVRRDNLRNRHAIEREYLRALRGARQRFELICPYFYPSARLLRALLNAARRGVEVRLLLQGQFDYRIADWAARALYEQLLDKGVRIFEYRAAFLHAKVALADEDWATLGSSNLDPTSLLLNLEANVVVSDARFVADLRQEFLKASAGAVEVQREAPQPGWRGWRGWLRRGVVAWLAQVYLRAAGSGSLY